MIELIVNIDNKEVQKLLEQLPELYRQDAPVFIAEAGAELTRAHLMGVAGKRHRGRTPRNFYVEAAKSVLQKVVPEGAEISIDHTGFALRYEGGTVRPSGRVSLITGKPIRHLSIPITGSGAEGKTPGDFKNLFFIKGRSGKGFLAGKKGNGMIGLLFALVPKTTHKEDKSILPTESEYQQAAEAGINELINEVTR